MHKALTGLQRGPKVFRVHRSVIRLAAKAVWLFRLPLSKSPCIAVAQDVVSVVFALERQGWNLLLHLSVSVKTSDLTRLGSLCH